MQSRVHFYWNVLLIHSRLVVVVVALGCPTILPINGSTYFTLMVDIIFTLLELQLADIHTDNERNYSSISVWPVHTVIGSINTHTNTHVRACEVFSHSQHTQQHITHSPSRSDNPMRRPKSNGKNRRQLLGRLGNTVFGSFLRANVKRMGQC